ncbi:hypothetical protein ACFONL_12400 [Camelimonas fluminis]|uniref:Anti-sigma factor n=1 Tax=Camelimonas fluminis TaxID=1576911 RepID=A0ABV7UI14_9HYPH|nr:hypothetical protein [Camelimonas fluminis]
MMTDREPTMTSAPAAAQSPDDDLELLLPFYAAGKLSSGQTRQVEARLAHDAEFRRRLDLVEEERSQTVLLNDGIAAPSPAARERLFAMIDAETAARPASRVTSESRAAPASRAAPVRSGPGAWLAGLVEAFTPRAMGYAVAGLAALAVVQAGLLAHLASGSRQQPGGYVTASAPAQESGVHALARFAPGVTMADAGVWLQDNGMRIVDGPKPGGLWRLRIASDAAGKDAAMRKLQGSPELFATVLPE